MAKRIKLSNMLNVLLIVVLSFLLISCSSSSSDDWPKLEADQLWEELGQEYTEAAITSDNSLNDKGETILLPPTLTSPLLSLSDIDASLSDIERKLILHEKNIQLAVSKFEDSNFEDKDMHWRGVEIEKSRLNSDIGTLKNILYQLSDRQDVESEKKRATELLKRAEELMPDIIYNADIE